MAIFRGGLRSGRVRTSRRQPEVLDPQRPAGAPSDSECARSQTGIGRGRSLIYGSFARLAPLLPPATGPSLLMSTPDTLTMDPRSLEAARGTFSAVVVVHLFGQLADLPSLLTIAKDVPVIEDTAHAPLSYLYGRMAGSFGLACFYSFASTKYWPAGGGGLAVVNDPTLARKLSRATDVPFAALATRGVA